MKVKKKHLTHTHTQHTLLSIRFYKFLFFAEQQQQTNKYSQKSLMNALMTIMINNNYKSNDSNIKWKKRV